MTAVIIRALEAYLERLRSRGRPDDLAKEILRIGRRTAALPDHDRRKADTILGCGTDGTSERRRRRGR